MLGDQHDAWLAERITELDDGDIPALLSAARAFPLTGTKAQALDTALGYFDNNACRMQYAHFRSLGMFVGSGAVEAGCKAVVAQRLKLSGMRSTGRRHRHPHPPLPAGQRPVGRDLAAAAHPVRSSLTRHLTTTRTQTIPGQPKLPVSHLQTCPTPHYGPQDRKCRWGRALWGDGSRVTRDRGSHNRKPYDQGWGA